MGDEVEVTTTEAVKKMSDGSVKVTLEKYEEMVQKIADQGGRISNLNDTIRKLRDEPPIINRTIVHKTVEMQLQDHRVWGGTFMTVGVGLFAIGALRYKAGTKS
jgi:hydrogenase maturation factor